MTPQAYHEHPALGSTAVRDWIAGWSAGDMTEWIARYMTGPMLDRWRQEGAAVLPEWDGTAELVDAARFTGTSSTLRGSLVELFLWNAEDPAEIEWADGGKASERAIKEAKMKGRLILAKSLPRDTRVAIARSLPDDERLDNEENARNREDAQEKARRAWSVRDVMELHGLDLLRRQVSEFATLEGVGVKSRIDLAWDLPAAEEHGPGRVIVDFKLWTGWTWGVDHLVTKWGADVQAAHYRLISEALHPGVEHYSALLVVDPGGGGKLPTEFWHEFPEHEMQPAMAEVREALGQIAAMTQREENAA